MPLLRPVSLERVGWIGPASVSRSRRLLLRGEERREIRVAQARGLEGEGTHALSVGATLAARTHDHVDESTVEGTGFDVSASLTSSDVNYSNASTHSPSQFHSPAPSRAAPCAYLRAHHSPVVQVALVSTALWCLGLLLLLHLGSLRLDLSGTRQRSVNLSHCDECE